MSISFSRTKVSSRWLLAAAAILLAMQWLLPAPPARLLSEALHDAAHIPWFALLSWLFCCTYPYRRWPRWLLPVLLLALAVGAEVLQRVPSNSDLGRNVLGAALGWLLWHLRVHRGRWMTVLLVGLVLTAAQPLWLLAARSARDAAAPVLFAPSQFGWRALIDNSGGAPWFGQRVQVDGVQRESLAVAVIDRPWPGVRLRELDQRWQEGQLLRVDVFLVADQSIRWYVGSRHVGDRPGGATRSVGITLRPGLQQVSVPVAALTPGPDGAVQISELLFYSEASYAGARWHLLEVTLDR